MRDHEAFSALVPLAAAGSLANDELAAVEQHALACPECARELEVLRLYARGLRELPQPMAPAQLLQRTQARVMEARVRAAERRRNGLLLTLLSVFSWISGILVWMFARAVTGGVWKVLGVDLVGGLSWSLISAVLMWMTAGVTAFVMGRRNELLRREI